MQSSPAIVRIRQQYNIPVLLKTQSPSPSGVVDRKRIKVLLKRETQALQTHTSLSAQDNLRDSWMKLESDLNSASLGIAFHPGPRSREVCDLLIDGFAGLPLPGAIAVMGCDVVFLAIMEKLCRGQSSPYRMRTASGACIPLELPPILMFAAENEPSICKVMRAAEDLKSLDVNIDVTVVPSCNSRPEEFLNDRMQRFFHTHLVGRFPKMF